MSSKLPYMLSTGLVQTILRKIQEARRPERFTLDYLSTKLGHGSGSARPMIPLLKRMGFLASDGSPTPLYDQFRNAHTQGSAVAQGLKNAYSELFDRNEYVYELSKEKLTSLITEITGAAKDDRTTSATVGTFMALNDLADFDADAPDQHRPDDSSERTTSSDSVGGALPLQTVPVVASGDEVDFRIGYTINLNLPESTDPEVFTAIFRALKDNLLKS